MAPLTAAEVMKHPEFPKVIWDLKPAESGEVSVAKGRGGPFDISYEVHGTGEICLVVCSVLWKLMSFYYLLCPSLCYERLASAFLSA